MDYYAVYRFPVGNLKIGATDKEIIYVGKTDDELGGNKTELTDLASVQLYEYFDGKRKEFDLSIKAIGTEFQMKVWNALRKIPYGETRTYGEIATTIGNPKACRAVGGANNKNPIGIIIPCHRVIGSNGDYVGYAGGLEMKEYLLQLERKGIT